MRKLDEYDPFIMPSFMGNFSHLENFFNTKNCIYLEYLGKQVHKIKFPFQVLTYFAVSESDKGLKQNAICHSRNLLDFFEQIRNYLGIEFTS